MGVHMVSFELASDPNFKISHSDSDDRKANAAHPNTNLKMFDSRGDRDEPVGLGGLSAPDKMHASGIDNNFGRMKGFNLAEEDTSLNLSRMKKELRNSICWSVCQSDAVTTEKPPVRPSSASGSESSACLTCPFLFISLESDKAPSSPDTCYLEIFDQVILNELDQLSGHSSTRIRWREDLDSVKMESCEVGKLRSDACNRGRMEEGLILILWNHGCNGALYSFSNLHNEMIHYVGTLHSSFGSREEWSSSDGLKVVCSNFQCVVWSFRTLSDQFHSDESRGDIGPDLLAFLSQVRLSQAQGCKLEKSILGHRKLSSIIKKVDALVADYFKQAFRNNESSNYLTAEETIAEVIGSRHVKASYKPRYIGIVYNTTNNELFRTKTLVNNATVPFHQQHETHYNTSLDHKKRPKLTEVLINKKRSKNKCNVTLNRNAWTTSKDETGRGISLAENHMQYVDKTWSTGRLLPKKPFPASNNADGDGANDHEQLSKELHSAHLSIIVLIISELLTFTDGAPVGPSTTKTSASTIEYLVCFGVFVFVMLLIYSAIYKYYQVKNEGDNERKLKQAVEDREEKMD